jgi:hypothetical protein
MGRQGVLQMNREVYLEDSRQSGRQRDCGASRQIDKTEKIGETTWPEKKAPVAMVLAHQTF